jgi:hypothetical protein
LSVHSWRGTVVHSCRGTCWHCWLLLLLLLEE